MVSWITIKENIVSYLSQSILGLIGLSLLTIAFLFAPDTLLQKLQHLPTILIAKTILGLLGLCFLLAAYIIYSKPKYRFYPELGVEGDFPHDVLICPKCKNKLRHDKLGWSCLACGTQVSFPDLKIATDIIAREEHRKFTIKKLLKIKK